MVKGLCELKCIGWFSTMEKVKEVRDRYKKMEGFRDTPQCFFVEKYKIDKTQKWKVIKCI